MTIQELLNEGRKELLIISGDDAFLECALLLAYALKTNREYLIAHIEETLSENIMQTYRNVLQRRKLGEPIAYLVGHKEFYGLDFLVNPNVLIPRPETEVLVDEVLHLSKKMDVTKTLFIDVGTGSGVVALTVAKHIPDTLVLALDISRDALEVAQKNKEALGIENVVLLQSDLFQNLPEVKEENIVIMANLPYISPEEHKIIDATVRDFEPFGALVAVEDGVGLYKKMFADIPKEFKNKKVTIVLECDPGQIKKIKEMVRFTFMDPNIRIFKDLSGQERGGVIEIKI